MDKQKEIERSIIKTYRKEIWTKFTKAVTDFQLIKENDKIMVCISGGKDSFLLAKCIQEIKKHGKISFEDKYVVMDPGYSEDHLKKIKENAKILGIELEIFKTDIFEVANMLNEKSPCYLCARMRRGHLYNKAKELGCNKIALGHHFNDVIETTLLSMFYGAEFKTMLPKIKSDNFENVELIRPLYYVKENSIISWTKYNNLDFINCACRFTEKIALGHENESKRKEVKEIIRKLKEINPNIDDNIFKSAANVNLDAIIASRKKGTLHSYLEEWEEEK